MIPILYEKTEKAFTSNGIGRLIDAKSCVVKEEENSGEYTLDLEYPFNGAYADELKTDRIISVIPYDGADHRQAFRIYKMTKKANGTYQVAAHHITYQKAFIPIRPITAAMSCKNAFQIIPVRAVGEFPFTLYTDIDKVAPFATDKPMSLGTLLMDEWKGEKIVQNGSGVAVETDEWDDPVDTNADRGGIQKIYGGTFEWDNWTIKLLANRGRDNGVQIRYGKNLIDLTDEENIGETITGVLPYWTDSEDGNMKTYISNGQEFSPVYSTHVSDFAFPRIAVLDMSSMFDQEEYIANADDAPSSDQIYSKSLDYIQENKIGEPDVNIEVSFQHLADTEEYKDIAPLEHVQLCDTVYIYFEKLGINKKAKVVSYEYDVLRDRYNTITLGSYKDNFMTKLANGATTEAQAAAARSALELANAKVDLRTEIKGVSGEVSTLREDFTTQTAWLQNGEGYVVPKVENGNWTELWFMDKQTEGAATQALVVNKNGIGFKTKDTNGAWSGFNQAWTLGGVMTLGGVNNKSGKIILYDSTGLTTSEHIIGYWDNTGLHANNGEFSGELKGATGSFSGTLSAATGSFKGVVTADELNATTAGTVGNLTIQKETDLYGAEVTTLKSYADGYGYLELLPGRVSCNKGDASGSCTMYAGALSVDGVDGGNTIMNGKSIVMGGSVSVILGSGQASLPGGAVQSVSGIYTSGRVDANTGGFSYIMLNGADLGDQISDHNTRITALENKSGDSGPNSISITASNDVVYDDFAPTTSVRAKTVYDIDVGYMQFNSGAQTIDRYNVQGKQRYLSFSNFAASSSDGRVKTNIENLDGDKINQIYMSLYPKKFNYKEKMDESRFGLFYGLIAQEVIESFEKANVDWKHASIITMMDSGKEDESIDISSYVDGADTYYGINYNNFHAMHIAMIQQQEHRIEELEKENTDLKARLEKLESIIFAKA